MADAPNFMSCSVFARVQWKVVVVPANVCLDKRNKWWWCWWWRWWWWWCQPTDEGRRLNVMTVSCTFATNMLSECQISIRYQHMKILCVQVPTVFLEVPARKVLWVESVTQVQLELPFYRSSIDELPDKLDVQVHSHHHAMCEIIVLSLQSPWWTALPRVNVVIYSHEDERLAKP